MRCYFMRDGHVAAVEVLDRISSDEEAIRAGSVSFIARIDQQFEGFEIWDRARKVYGYPDENGVSRP